MTHGGSTAVKRGRIGSAANNLLGVVVGLQRRASGGILAPILTHKTGSVSMLFLLPAIFA